MKIFKLDAKWSTSV